MAPPSPTSNASAAAVALPGDDAAPVALADLDDEGRALACTAFRTHVLPTLTPLGLDHGRHVANLLPGSRGLAVLLRAAKRTRRKSDARLALVPLPPVLPATLPLGDARPGVTVATEELIRAHAAELFPGCAVDHVAPFRAAPSPGGPPIVLAADAPLALTEALALFAAPPLRARS